jgi:hypothetical protein
MKPSIAPLVLLTAGISQAHVVSMSSGELTVDDRRAIFELRMPMYEMQHVAHPETDLLDHVKFAGGRRISSSCKQDESTYVCTANYEFNRPMPDKLDVECTLFQVTVPNHVHLLHATQGTNGDQVVFDQRFTNVEVRFRPPSPFELMVRDSSAGVVRLVTCVPAMLFVALLALAARSRREAVWLVTLFLGGEWIAKPLAPRVPIGLSPGFLEAAMALTVAYLAVDVLLLPDARSRWAAIPVLGLVHGFWFAAFPASYLTGGSAVQVILAGVLTIGALRLPPTARTIWVAVALAAGLGWFIRLLF